jgi:hypothetical protein
VGRGRAGRAAIRAASFLLAVAATSAAAFWNGFPLLFYDTGGYVERPFVEGLAPGRGALYGVLLAALDLGLSWWPVVLAQGALTVWLLRLLLRAHGAPSGPLPLAALSLLLAAATALPWFSGQLMPDALAPVAVLSLLLLGFRPDGLGPRERAALAVVAAVATGAHLSTWLLGLGVALMALPFRRLVPLAAVLAGFALIPLANGLASGVYALTPGGPAFVFGRLVQDGIAERFLADRCPSPEYRLCAWRGRLPATADEFLWSPDGPLRDLGGWDAAAPEFARIARESLLAYPGMHLRTALRSTLQQLVTVRTGDGIDAGLHHARWTIGRFYPDRLPAHDAARQQRGELSFAGINRVHVPVALGAAALLALLPALALRRGDAPAACLAAVVLAALLGNAAITGVLSNPHDRYQSRVAWLAVAAAWTVLGRWLARRPPERPRQAGERAGALGEIAR